MTEVAVATTSPLAAEAAAEVADLGGNAVDCAIAAALLAINTEPGVCALAGGGYVTVWAAGREPVTIDGNVAIPGLGLTGEERGHGTEPVTMDYGGGISTLIGAGSVGVPGTPAALERAWQKFGKARWQDIFAPTIRASRDGFPLSSACHYYLGYSGKPVFGHSDDGYRALHHQDDSLRDAGSPIVVPHLADTLAEIAEEGARAFYSGDIARKIVEHVRAGNGMLNEGDMRNYEAILRPSLQTGVGSWSLATNPPPAVGGAVLSAMLRAFGNNGGPRWDKEALARLIDVQHACLDYRRARLDLADDVAAEVAPLLENARNGQLLARWSSSSTVHTSAVDGDGTGCAITASSGYGSGEMPAETGLWLNNCLGELELNRRGLGASPAGARLPSNMAPSVARNENSVMAVGSPGADRITTALMQYLVNTLVFGMQPGEAIAHPRLHLDTSGATDRLCAESGLDLPETDLPVKLFDELNMYFGGVGSASFDRDSGFGVAADPRREGGVFVSAIDRPG